MSPTRLTVALLFGGRSGEHEVSLRSGASVAEALALRHDVQPVLVDKGGRWLLQESPAPRPSGGTPVFLAPSPDDLGRLRRTADGVAVARPDVYFPVLHGTFGEDGTVQGVFELAAVPYVGSGVLASAVAMDKEIMKALFAQAGLPQGRYRVLRGRDPAEEALVLEAFGLPVFVKPANLGSSVAVTKVKRAGDFASALDLAFAYDRKAVVEAAIEAREIEVSVLGNDHPEASLPGEIVPDREFYDYESKYSAESRTRLLIPAPLDAAAVAEVQRLGLAAFRAVDASGYARVDCFLDRRTGQVLLNEINTIPGFTSISMFPKMWEATGLAYPDLLARLLDLARERHHARGRLRTDYGADKHTKRYRMSRPPLRLAGSGVDRPAATAVVEGGPTPGNRVVLFKIVYKTIGSLHSVGWGGLLTGRLWRTAVSRCDHAITRASRGHSRFPHLRPQAKPHRLWSMACSPGEKMLDKVKSAPYATPSMRGSLSPEMLTRGATVQIWTERGDPLNAGQEEGCQEGDQEEEVGAPGKKGGWSFTPHFSLVRDLTASIAGSALRTV